MVNAPLFAEFADDELLRAPLTFDRVIDAVHLHWRGRHPGAALPRADADPARVLSQHRDEVIQHAVRTLRRAVQAELQRPGIKLDFDPFATKSQAALSLIDEADVSADIEIARCIEAIALRAESELRELQTFTSALAGDPNVSRDTNPFRPEVMVRSLWRGAQALPLQRSTQAAFMREAAQPLSQALCLAYRGAVQRLQARGIAPAAHRTIVTVATAMAATTRPQPRPPADLRVVRDSLPLPWQPLQSAEPSIERTVGAGRPARQADPRLVGLLTRLFDQIHADRSLPAELCALLRRLQAAAERVALHDDGLLDNYEHPLWRFMDELAHHVTLATAADRLRLLGLAQHLVDQLDGVEGHDSARFAWAIERVQAMNRHAVSQALAAAATEVERRRQEAMREHLAWPPSGAADSDTPLDIGSLDTVPADLMPEPTPLHQAALAPLPGQPSAAAPASSPAPGPSLQAQPGEYLRAYLQGDWRLLMLLATDAAPALWLLRDQVTERLWSVRPAAVQRLAHERLARTLRVRSLVRRAAERVMRAG